MASVSQAAEPNARKPKRQRLRRRFTGDSVGTMLAILRRVAHSWNAPVLTLLSAEEEDPFLTLIGCVLSLRTKDETTAAASRRLFAKAR
jgi:endonuclease III